MAVVTNDGGLAMDGAKALTATLLLAALAAPPVVGGVSPRRESRDVDIPPTTRFAGYYTVTAYCSCRKCCGSQADGITATGKHVRKGMVAADWHRLPPGTKLRLSCFPGQTFVVEDKGGAIKGRRIDVFMPSHRQAQKFGIRRKTKVWIVDR